jgi:outer membrane protein TolC
LRLTSEVVDRVTQVRQAWVRAVAAGQTLKYAQQVFDSAEAGAELARRMQSVGNFNRITRAREQSFYADAATRLATANHQATAAREELVRLLGLDEVQAQALKLPERLPDLPKQALEPEAVGTQATRGRIDIRLAQAALDTAVKAQGLNTVTSFTDIELRGRKNTAFDNAAGTRSSARGYEVGVRLPIFDWGGLQRDAMSARTLAAANQLEATIRIAGSNLRESYSAYRTAFDVARHHRDEVVPLRKVIAEENQLRYNGMLIGVFELMADARDQVSTVMAAIDAEQQFWLADAALQASVIGRPTSTTLAASSSAPSGGGAGH